MFSGNLEIGAPIETLIAAAAQLRHETEVVFALIGAGPSFEKAWTLCNRAFLPNVLFLPYQEREALAYSLSAGQVHLVTHRRGLNGLRVPCKTYGILAAGRPILYLGDPASETADLLRDERIGYVIEEDDVGGLVTAIRCLKSDVAGQKEISARARAIFESRYDSRPAIALFENVVSAIVNPGATAPQRSADKRDAPGNLCEKVA
jgi:colanic acid biosynthesis glycosyl transferase WcaI